MLTIHRFAFATGALALVLVACGTPTPTSPVTATVTTTTAEPAGSTPATTPDVSTPAPTARPTSAADAGIRWVRSGLGLELGVLEVPLDYADPSGRQIVIPLARRVASDPANRIGTLLFIAGGPGGAGTDYVQRALNLGLPAGILERFDLVSFDPRGTPAGTGSPRVDCAIGAEAQTQLASLTPADPADLDVADVQAWTPIVRDACEQGSQGILPYLDTGSTIQDIERIRLALGEQQLSITGQSWGTLAGALYADAHPDRVRALVLDAPLDPALGQLAFTRDKAKAAQAGLDGFLAWCADTPSCAFHSDGDPRAALDTLLESLIRTPGALTAYDVADGLFLALQDHPAEEVADALAAARDGDTATIAGWASPESSPHLGEYGLSVLCPDLAAPSEPAEYARLADELRSSAPDYAVWAVLEAGCVDWPQAAARDVQPVRAAGAPPILILSGTEDMLTPHAWAEALERELADATLLTRASKDHGSLFRGDACIDAAVADYLVNLAMPAKGTTCD